MLTAQQLENHQKYITGSKVASILGLPGAYMSKYQLFACMKGLAGWPESTERMKAGWYMERAMHEWCIHEWLMNLVEGPKDGKFHPDYPFIYGLIDRLKLIKNKPATVLDFKNVDKFFEKKWEEGPPETLKAQLYLYMSIYDLPGEFVTCFGGNHFERYELPRHPKIEAFILKKCCEFWEDLNASRWPDPDNSAACTEALKMLYSNGNGEMKAGIEEELRWAEKYEKFKAEEKQAKEEKDKYGNLLRERIGDSQGLIFADGAKAAWKKTKPKKMVFNEKQFEEENPDLYKRYLYLPKGYRQFRVSLKNE